MFERTASCPCQDRHPERSCAACGWLNARGHARRTHRGFAQVVDRVGSSFLCTVCAAAAVIRTAEWAAYDVTLMVDIPALNLVGWREVMR